MAGGEDESVVIARLDRNIKKMGIRLKQSTLEVQVNDGSVFQDQVLVMQVKVRHLIKQNDISKSERVELKHPHSLPPLHPDRRRPHITGGYDVQRKVPRFEGQIASARRAVGDEIPPLRPHPLF